MSYLQQDGGRIVIFTMVHGRIKVHDPNNYNKKLIV